MEELELQDRPKRSDAHWMAWGGALLCALAVLFTWGQLALDSEYLLLVAAFCATALGVTERPASRPELGMQLLLGIAVFAAAWFSGGAYFGLVGGQAFHPLPLLLGLGLSLAGASAVALTTWRRVDEKRAARLVYALTAIGILASGVIYYQLFTVGVAEHQVARRLILTLFWLGAGLILFLRSRGRAAFESCGRVLAGVAFAKALLYDTTHLDGGLRILALLITGGLLLGGAWALSRKREAA